MSYVPFHTLPPSAKTWVFGASEALELQVIDRIRDEMTSFIREWTAHGADLPASFEVMSGRFLVVAADDAAQPGGCSVDRLFRLVSALGESAGLSLLDSSLVFWRGGDGEVRSATREEFRQLAVVGNVGASTMVFDLAVDHLDALRSGRFEKRACDSWHARLLSA